MKRLVMLLLTATLVAGTFVITGCGKSQATEPVDQAGEEAEVSAPPEIKVETNASVSAADLNARTSTELAEQAIAEKVRETYTFSNRYEIDGYGYDDIQTLYIIDEDRAVYSQSSIYNDCRASSSKFSGTYEKTDNGIRFHFVDIEDPDWLFDYDFYIENGQVVSVVDTFTESEESEGFFDYADYACQMTVFGELGDIEVTLDELGYATATVKIDGESMEMTGPYYVDKDLGRAYEIDLYSDLGYSLQLDLMDIGEENLNYSGSITRPLTAG